MLFTQHCSDNLLSPLSGWPSLHLQLLALEDIHFVPGPFLSLIWSFSSGHTFSMNTNLHIPGTCPCVLLSSRQWGDWGIEDGQVGEVGAGRGDLREEEEEEEVWDTR